MAAETNLINSILSIFLFPTLFQEEFIGFTWGSMDPFWMMTLKRLFLLLPALAVVAVCWITIVAVISVVFRNNRQNFVVALIVTWWDLGKSVLSFWGGLFRFVWMLIFAIFTLIKMLLLGLVNMIVDIIAIPFRLIGNITRSVLGSSIPWIAVTLTLFWCVIEAIIFTYVTTPMVVDTFSNITGNQFSELSIRIPLFIFLLFIVLGSYAVLSTFIESVRSKNIHAILGIGVIEIIVLMVEVVFLYREFVDSLVPWFAQYSENFELGIFWTLAISVFAWFGIRSLSWFLFAAHGTPTIMRVIQGRGVEIPEQKAIEKMPLFVLSSDFMNKLKEDAAFLEEQGEKFLASFMLPPLQVIAAMLNFAFLLFTSKHLFELPFRKFSDIIESKVIMQDLAPKPERKAKSVREEE